MTGRLVLALFAIALNFETAGSEIFECVESDGSIRFAGDPHACDQARPHALRGRIEHVPAAPDPSPTGTVSDPGSSVLLSDALSGLRLEQVLLGEDDVGSDWAVVGETPIEPIRDPDLLGWGVRTQRARHYTRQSNGSGQVCSIEIWAFEDTALARAAHENFAYPDWQIDREGSLLVMLRALTRGGENQQNRKLFAACLKLGEEVRVRAAGLTSD